MSYMTKRYYQCRVCEKVLRCPCGFVGMQTGPEHCGKPTRFVTDKQAAEILRGQRKVKAR